MGTVWITQCGCIEDPKMQQTGMHFLQIMQASIYTEGTVVQQLIHYSARKWLQHTATQKQ